jgi:3-isopropylmalate dehydrogenase
VLAGTDLLVVRELTGGLYYGEPRGMTANAAHNTMRYTRREIERIARRAFDAARLRRGRSPRSTRPTCSKRPGSGGRSSPRSPPSYPDVRLDHMYVDACAMKLALAPGDFDVILTENLFGDILSDEAGAIVGSLGLLPSASLGTAQACSSRSTARRPTSRAGTWPTRSGPLRRPRCCCGTRSGSRPKPGRRGCGGSDAGPHGLRTPDLATPHDDAVGTARMGEAVAAAVAGQPGRCRPGLTRPAGDATRP